MNDYHKTIEENINPNTFYINLNTLMTVFIRQKFDNYQYKNNYKIF